MLKRIGLIGLTSAALTFAFVACGDDNGAEDDFVCTTDADCQVGEICHPQANVCVQTCTTSEDCPESAGVCEAIDAPADGGTGTGTLICKCQTDALCGEANAEFVCSDAFEVCVPGCTLDADCPTGLVCDTSAGECVAAPADGGLDGGMDAGICNWQTCSTETFDSTGLQCTGTGCAAGPACTGIGRSTCDYGSFCANGVCGFVPFPTNADCVNFYVGDHPNGPVWTPESGTGPVIYEISEISHGQGTADTAGTEFEFCNSDATQWNIRVRAYNPEGWPDTRAGLSGFFYVPTSGQDQDVVGASTLLRPGTGYNRNPADVNDAEFQINVCSETAMDALQPGFYFTGGNEACADL